MKALTNDEFINKLKLKKPEFFYDFKILNEYKNSRDFMYIQSKIGIHKILANNLITKNYPITAETLIDKVEHYQNEISKIPNLSNLKLLKVGSFTRKNSIVKDKYGELFVCIKDLLEKQHCPTIISAINKSQYYKNIFNDFGYEYDLNKVNYINSKTKIMLSCKFHGDFEIYPSRIYGGFCCPKCKKPFNNKVSAIKHRNKLINVKAYVYIIKCTNELESFYKIGISRRPNNRFSTLPFKIEPLKLIKINAYDAVFLEHNLHKYHGKYKYEPITKFDGETECFSKILLKT